MFLLMFILYSFLALIVPFFHRIESLEVNNEQVVFKENTREKKRICENKFKILIANKIYI